METLTIKFKRKRYLNQYNIDVKEQFHTICNNIEPKLSKENSILMVTSSAQKQSIVNSTAYLALAFSEQRKQVLVIDANFHQPSLHHVFNIGNSFGLSNLLLKEQHQNSDNTVKVADYLYCLPTGESLYEPASLFRLESFPNLIEVWKENFDVILFHTSDYLNAPDARIIAKHCGGIVLVIQEGRDKFEKIIAIKKDLERGEHEITGTVIIS